MTDNNIKKFQCNDCNFITNYEKRLENHYSSQKHINKIYSIRSKDKKENKFESENLIKKNNNDSLKESSTMESDNIIKNEKVNEIYNELVNENKILKEKYELLEKKSQDEYYDYVNKHQKLLDEYINLLNENENNKKRQYNIVIEGDLTINSHNEINCNFYNKKILEKLNKYILAVNCNMLKNMDVKILNNEINIYHHM